VAGGLVVALLAAGCTTVWSRPGLTVAQFHRDFDCQLASMGIAPPMAT
jgi:hypothetical protein